MSSDQMEEAKRLGVVVAFEEPILSMRFVLIPGGEFLMGTSEDEVGRDDERPQHPARVSPYYMATCEVTQAQMEQFSAEHTARLSHRGAELPAYGTSWQTAMQLAAWLTAQSPREGIIGYALPTEAQWERACRAGSSACCTGTKETANIDGAVPRPVRSYPPNSWGLYDMLGNASEWCREGYAVRFYASAEALELDPAQDNQILARVGATLRGGDFMNGAFNARCASRRWAAPDSQAGGVRLVALISRGK